MKNTLIIAAGLLLTSSSFAYTINDQATVDTGTYATESAAYAAGFDFIDSLKTMNRSELGKTLSLPADNTVRQIKVDSSRVELEAFATHPEQIQYRAIVNLDYHFNQPLRED